MSAGWNTRRGPGTRGGRGPTAPARSAAALLVGLLISACGSTPVREIPPSTSPYDQIPPAAAAEFGYARERLLAGDAPAARGLLKPLVEAHPDCIVLGVWWQEAEIAAGDAEDVRRHCEDIARLFPSAASCVLAARVQDDRAAATTWLARAAEYDPQCPWVHHARAFLAAQAGEYEAARAALSRALAADPGHLYARRLSAWMLARDGAATDARAELAAWVARAAGDVRVPPGMVEDARLDLALLDLQLEDADEAEAVLEQVDAAQAETWRLHAVRACVLETQGDVERALVEVEAARAAAPRELLPVVQEAVLSEKHLDDPERALSAWRTVRALAAGRDDLASAFETLRARVRAERLERAAGPKAP